MVILYRSGLFDRAFFCHREKEENPENNVLPDILIGQLLGKGLPRRVQKTQSRRKSTEKEISMLSVFLCGSNFQIFIVIVTSVPLSL